MKQILKIKGEKTMRILYYSWNGLMQSDTIEHLKKLGHDIHIIYYVFSNFEKDSFFENKINKHLKTHTYDCVFSLNYFPIISKTCMKHDLPYVSWIYDHPIPLTAGIENPRNYLFHFDKIGVETWKQKGVQHIYHMPLAVNTERLDNLAPLPEQIEDFTCFISMVGRLYDRYDISQYTKNASDFSNGYLDALTQMQLQVYGKDICLPCICSNYFRAHANIPESSLFNLNINLQERVTNIDRIRTLNHLAEHFPTRLYTSSARTSELSTKIDFHSSIAYYNEMPLAFRYSKFNLNIGLRSIESGISLRALDIMACGGLLVSTYQPELLDYFVPGEDFLLYESLEDLHNQIAYYAEHEEERAAIARSGYEKVKTYFDYSVILQRIFDTLPFS